MSDSTIKHNKEQETNRKWQKVPESITKRPKSTRNLKKEEKILRSTRKYQGYQKVTEFTTKKSTRKYKKVQEKSIRKYQKITTTKSTRKYYQQCNQPTNQPTHLPTNIEPIQIFSIVYWTCRHWDIRTSAKNCVCV